MGFADHFSGIAHGYAAFRPTYPASLYDFLAAEAGGRARAWDCGTGSGQAAAALAERFDAVVGTDPSAEQIAQAPLHPRITYRVARESDSGLAPRSADLVTAAQAAHWFDAASFHREVARVLRPRGLLAVWCYELTTVDPEVDALVDRDALLGYLGTWSAVARCRAAEGRDPLDDLRVPFARAWPDPREARPVRWPLSVRAGRSGG